MKFLYVSITIAGIGLIGGLLAYQHYFSLGARLNRYLTNWERQGKLSASVLVAQKGKIILCKGYGMANYEHMVPNTPETKFHIGSITKQFTSMAIMQLVQAGRLKVIDTIASIFPDYPHGKEITIYQLLTMSSGIPDYLNDFADFDVTKPLTISDLIASFKNKPLNFVPGSKYKYSNSGYVILAAIIEKLSGQSYETYLQKHIFKPLGMSNTGLLRNQPLLSHRAQGYNRVASGLQNSPYYVPNIGFGAGFLYSTVGDMYLWDRALYTDKLLAHDLIKQLWQPNLDNYALGWQTGVFDGHNYVWHGGDFRDGSSRILRFMNDDVCIIILENFDLISSPIDRIAKNLTAIVFGKKTLIEKVVDTSVYDFYVGQYAFAPDAVFTIIRDHNSLFFKPKGQKPIEMLPSSETTFFNDDEIYMQISFIKDLTGKVVELIASEGDQKLAAKKINDQGHASQVNYDEYIGTYIGQKPEEQFVVTKKNDLLFIKLSGHEFEYPVFAESDIEFFLKHVDAQVSFIRDNNGQIKKAIVHLGAQDIAANKIG